MKPVNNVKKIRGSNNFIPVHKIHDSIMKVAEKMVSVTMNGLVIALATI